MDLLPGEEMIDEWDTVMLTNQRVFVSSKPGRISDRWHDMPLDECLEPKLKNAGIELHETPKIIKINPITKKLEPIEVKNSSPKHEILRMVILVENPILVYKFGLWKNTSE